MSVNLFTEDGKEKLSGSHCPATIKLICNAVDVHFLRWTYNNPIYITSFQTDNEKNVDLIMTDHTAFPFVQLTQFNVYQNQENQQRINASAILNTNLSELYKQNIEIISCGGSVSVIKTISVNISILQPSFHSVSPNVYTSVLVRYESGLLSSIDVSWRKFQVSISNKLVELLHAWRGLHVATRVS